MDDLVVVRGCEVPVRAALCGGVGAVGRWILVISEVDFGVWFGCESIGCMAGCSKLEWWISRWWIQYCCDMLSSSFMFLGNCADIIILSPRRDNKTEHCAQPEWEWSDSSSMSTTKPSNLKVTPTSQDLQAIRIDHPKALPPC